jgi:uncharacterized membrane protein
VLGWTFHEEQWRGGRSSFDGRQGDVERIYATGSEEEIDETRAILKRYEIDYIVVGPRERSTYPDLDLDRLTQIGERVYPVDGIDFGPRDYVIIDVGGS